MLVILYLFFGKGSRYFLFDAYSTEHHHFIFIFIFKKMVKKYRQTPYISILKKKKNQNCENPFQGSDGHAQDIEDPIEQNCPCPYLFVFSPPSSPRILSLSRRISPPAPHHRPISSPSISSPLGASPSLSVPPFSSQCSQFFFSTQKVTFFMLFFLMVSVASAACFFRDLIGF